MTYIDDLIGGGANFNVRRGEGTASFTPVSGRDEDLDGFQVVVRELRRNEGDGYSIVIEHQMDDRRTRLIDLVVIRIDP